MPLKGTLIRTLVSMRALAKLVQLVCGVVELFGNVVWFVWHKRS
jgi:hypothetical protein